VRYVFGDGHLSGGFAVTEQILHYGLTQHRHFGCRIYILVREELAG